MRKTMIAIAAAAALGAATMATAAFAAPHGGAGFGGGGGHVGGGGGAAMAHGGGGFAAPRGNFGGANMGRPGGSANFARTAPGNFAGSGGNFAARGFDRDHRRGFRGGIGFGGLYAFGGPDYYALRRLLRGDSCWQRQLVPTPYGMQWQLGRRLPVKTDLRQHGAPLQTRGGASLYANRPRSCGAVKSSSGPIGTMPVGFTWRWLP